MAIPTNASSSRGAQIIGIIPWLKRWFPQRKAWKQQAWSAQQTAAGYVQCMFLANLFHNLQMEDSWNEGTPNWLVYNGKSNWNGWFGCTPILGNLQIYTFNYTSCITAWRSFIIWVADKITTCNGDGQSGSPIVVKVFAEIWTSQVHSLLFWSSASFVGYSYAHRQRWFASCLW